jgi:chorismate synthase
MSTEEQPEELKEEIKVTQPRPGHADLAGAIKYGFDDVRNVLERASARETAGRVIAGAIFKQFLKNFGIEIASHTIQIGNVRLKRKDYEFNDVKSAYEKEPETRCIDEGSAQNMKYLVENTRKNQDTLGGTIETWAVNVPVGLGSHVQFDRKIDGQIAQAIMSIQSVKAVEIGSGLEQTTQFGSNCQDEIYYKKSEKKYYRKTNHAGGIEGGITNGEPIIVKTYHKPISTIYKPLNTVDIKTKEPAKATVERSDICIVPRGGVVSEAMLAFVISKNMLEKFGGDNIDETKYNCENYLSKL